MKIKVDITEDHVKLVKALRFERFGSSRSGIDKYSLYGGSYVYEDMAWILGLQDKAIPETKEDPMGARYEKETQERLDKLAEDMEEHLEDYESILHQFCDRGGLKPGTYACQDNVRIWEYIPNKEEKQNRNGLQEVQADKGV